MKAISSGSTLFEAVKTIYIRISRAALRAGRSPGEIRLIAVTKTVRTEAIVESIEAGLRDFGENRIQEARDKILKIAPRGESGLAWHYIGHLQKNKAATAVEFFDLIHSIDSADLAAEVDRKARMRGKIQRILIQVKLSDEESKHGIPEEGLDALLEEIGRMKNLKAEGLMTIPPFFEMPEDARPYFRRLRLLREGALRRGYPLRELSMGMSNDFETAIEEGATMVRIGSCLFGERKTGP